VDPEVLKLARWVRRRVKRWVLNNPEIMTDMTGACAIASYALYRVLRAKGWGAEFCCGTSEWKGHCWVELNGHVLDITATQFDGPVIAVFPIRRPPMWFSKAVTGLKTLQGKTAEIEVESWESQSPIMYRRHVRRLVQQA